MLVTLTLWAIHSEPFSIDDIENTINCWEVNCCYVKRTMFVRNFLFHLLEEIFLSVLFLEEITYYTYIESAFVSLNVVLLFLTFKKIYITEREIDARNGRATRNQQLID